MVSSLFPQHFRGKNLGDINHSRHATSTTNLDLHGKAELPFDQMNKPLPRKRVVVHNENTMRQATIGRCEGPLQVEGI